VIFSVQKFLEDHLERRGLADVDDYAIKAANAFERAGVRASEEAVCRELARIRTTFFRRNAQLNRREFEAALTVLLRRRFQKKNDSIPVEFEQGLRAARDRVRSHRRSIGILLREFRRTVESRVVDTFWESRKQNRLRSRPEKIAQALFAVFAKAVVGSKGLVLREVASGIGFVDVAISFGGPLHLIELKILKGTLVGASQLTTYMVHEQRDHGWLLLIDARKTASRADVPTVIKTASGTIRTIVVEINPIPPHLA
jgi:hypothetical protein